MMPPNAPPPLRLENDHNVYILGAGFSRDAGMPLVLDFMQRMRGAHGWLNDHGRQREAEAIERVLRFRLHAAAAAYQVEIDVDNIESLFSLASASRDNLEREVRIAIAATLDYCEETTPLRSMRAYTDEAWSATLPTKKWHQKREPSNSRAVWTAPRYSLYAACLLGWFSSGPYYQDGSFARNTFITFNYDTLLERGLEQIGLSPVYFDPVPNFVDDAGAGASRRKAVEVLKLHGSINWRLDGDRLHVARDYKSVAQASDGEPQIIPPTWDKQLSGHLAPIWSRAVELLSSATRIVVIGFSMPEADAHFRYLMAAGLQENVSIREVRFVNPDLETIKRRAHAVFRRPGLLEFEVHDDRRSTPGPYLEEFFTGFLEYGGSINRATPEYLHSIGLG